MRQIKCFGKINRMLRVGPLRPDGFHDIYTIYQSISLHDTLSMELMEKPGIVLTVSDPEVPSTRENFAWKAVELILNRTDYMGGVTIHIDKNIPSGGGLGGGSSNAAGSLLLLNSMLDEPLSRNDLQNMGSTLGSDVPFFLVGGTVFGTGRGEKVKPLPDCEPFSLLAVFPDISFSTREMYSLLDRTEKDLLFEQLTQREIEALLSGQLKSFENSFDRIVSKKSEKVANVMQELRNEGFSVMLAGSGSTFLIFDEQYPVEKIDTRLPAGWKCVRLRSRTRREALGEFLF